VLVFHIGGEEAEYVRVSDIQDHGDGWFTANVELDVGAFSGRYSADFNAEAFTIFQTQLEALYRTVSGSAIFTSHEEQLELTLTCDATGHIRVRGEATDYAGTGNKLSFELEIDQTHVPGVLRDLQSAMERHLPRDRGAKP
jgi:hypothetical protein